MKLDDNTRSALHYLALGSVVLFVLLAVDRGLSGFMASSDPQFAALAPFQHGYLLGNGIEIVDTASTRGERIAWALVVAVGAAVITALVVRWLSHGNRSWTLGAARLVMVILLGWGVYSAFFVPVHHFFLRDRLVVEWRYRTLVGDVPIPFSKEIQLRSGQVIVRPGQDPASPCGEHVDLVLVAEQDLHMTTLEPSAGDCASAIAVAREQAAQAAIVVNGYLHRP